MRQYCDDSRCPNFLNGGGFDKESFSEASNCRLGFILKFRPPKSYTEINNIDWGYLMPKPCRLKAKEKCLSQFKVGS